MGINANEMRSWIDLCNEVTITKHDATYDIVQADSGANWFLQQVSEVYATFKLKTRDFTRPHNELKGHTKADLLQALDTLYSAYHNGKFKVNESGPLWAIYNMMMAYAYRGTRNDRAPYRWYT